MFMKHTVLKQNLIKFKANLTLDDKKYFLDYLKMPYGWELNSE